MTETQPQLQLITEAMCFMAELSKCGKQLKIYMNLTVQGRTPDLMLANRSLQNFMLGNRCYSFKCLQDEDIYWIPNRGHCLLSLRFVFLSDHFTKQQNVISWLGRQACFFNVLPKCLLRSTNSELFLRLLNVNNSNLHHQHTISQKCKPRKQKELDSSPKSFLCVMYLLFFRG